MRTRFALFAGMLATLMTTVAAHAIDIPIAGRRMHLTDSPQPQSRRNLMGFRDSNIDLSMLDPTVTGAIATVGDLGMGAPTAFDLPASGWSRVGGLGKDYKFKSHGATAIAARLVQGQTLRISAHGAGAYALAGATQNAVGVIVQIGTVRFCGIFGGTIGRNDGQTFLARRSPAPQSCPAFEQPQCVEDGDVVSVPNQETQEGCFDALQDAVSQRCCSQESGRFIFGTEQDPQACYTVCGEIID